METIVIQNSAHNKCIIEFIDSKRIQISSNHNTVTIPLELVRKIFMYKRRKFHKNYLFFFSMLFVTYLVDNIFFNASVSLILSQSVFALVISFLIKDYEFKLLIVKEFDFVELVVDSTAVELTKNFVQRINRKIPSSRKAFRFHKSEKNIALPTNRIRTNFVADEFIANPENDSFNTKSAV